MFANVSRSRLLPMSLPFRYFGAAVAFQLAAWSVLFLFPADFVAFQGGLGPVFAALHLATLGVLAMSAMGATLQLLPVATRQPVRALWAVRLAWWLLVPGIVAFAAAAGAYRADLIGPGAMLVAIALAIYGVLLFRNLREARGMRVVVLHGWAALACLLGLAATGIALVARYEHGIALDHAAWRSAHVALAAYGFMGLLAAGLSGFLLPMLAIAPPPPPRFSYGVLAVALAAIVLGNALLGLVAATVHVALMERSLRARLRLPFGPGLLLIRVSWACLLGSLVLAALDFPGGMLPFGVLLVAGWLLTFLLGVMQRILPFLASVHGSRGAPLVSALTPPRLLAAHAALHLGALALLFAAALTAQPLLARLAAGAGLAAAAAFAAFYAYVLVKVRSHGNPYPPSHPAPA